MDKVSISNLLLELKDLKTDIKTEIEVAKREIERAAKSNIDNLSNVEKKADSKIDRAIMMLEKLQQTEVAPISNIPPVQPWPLQPQSAPGNTHVLPQQPLQYMSPVQSKPLQPQLPRPTQTSPKVSSLSPPPSQPSPIPHTHTQVNGANITGTKTEVAPISNIPLQQEIPPVQSRPQSAPGNTQLPLQYIYPQVQSKPLRPLSAPPPSQPAPGTRLERRGMLPGTPCPYEGGPGNKKTTCGEGENTGGGTRATLRRRCGGEGCQ